MNLFQKIDNYLLHNFPNIWVTKVHIFLPIAAIFMFVIYLFNVILIGYNLKDSIPREEMGITLMIIPVLVFIVYWFIIQARYNVEKSGGKLSIPLEYMNFALYFLMFFVSYMLISFIPFTNDIKVANTVNRTELKEDIKNLNLGHLFVNNEDKIPMHKGRYKLQYNDYINSYYWGRDSESTVEAMDVTKDVAEVVKDGDYEIITEEETYKEEYEENVSYYYKQKVIKLEDFEKHNIPSYTDNLFVLATRNQLDEIVANYIYSYNKYTKKEILSESKELVDNRLKGYSSNIYYSTQQDEYNDYLWRNQVEYKVERISRLKLKNSGAFETNYGNDEYSKIVISWMLMLSLMVWIFKQIHWRDYLFGIIALFLTPVLLGIIGVFFGGILRLGEEFFFSLLFAAYVAAIIITIKGTFSKHKSRFSIVTAMYLHIFIPIIPMFYFLFLNEVYYSYDNRWEVTFDLIFYSSLIMGIVSILVFKYIYKRMRLLPNNK